jgi:hypothetical protein
MSEKKQMYLEISKVKALLRQNLLLQVHGNQYFWPLSFGFNLSKSKSVWMFENYYFYQILVEKILLKKQCHFLDFFFFQKSVRNSTIVIPCDFLSWMVALQTCIIKNFCWHNFVSPCVILPENDTQHFLNGPLFYSFP